MSSVPTDTKSDYSDPPSTSENEDNDYDECPRLKELKEDSADILFCEEPECKLCRESCK